MANSDFDIHHITAIAGDVGKNVRFYRDLLGLRLVKKTVNFDDPGTYHLYYGNESGDPGTILTFFPWSDRGLKGRPGTGQVTGIAFAVPENALDFWSGRLGEAGLSPSEPYRRFEETLICFEDPDGISLELVAVPGEQRPGWDNGKIPAEMAIRGFYGVAMSLPFTDGAESLLAERLGYRVTGESANRRRMLSPSGQTRVDLIADSRIPRGSMGVGAVHHIAWRIGDAGGQSALREKLLEIGYQVSPVMDRNYFQSIYFREPGGVLFEIATDPPGFTVDEPLEALGKNLRLPPWLESRRREIEDHLPKID
ncbi:MAG: ring-cleaving dioxygenase [Calditrichaeota bacterium]|nr:ring-cleaving dioxygenase [Calditrichota bacterium]